MKYFTQTDQASPIKVELAADLKGIESSQKFYKYVVYFSHEILVAMSEKKRKFEKCTKIVLWVYTWIKLACWHFSIEHFISGCLCEAVWILTCQFKSVSVSQRYLDSESITWRLIWHQERNSELHSCNQNQSINIVEPILFSHLKGFEFLSRLKMWLNKAWLVEWKVLHV